MLHVGSAAAPKVEKDSGGPRSNYLQCKKFTVSNRLFWARPAGVITKYRVQTISALAWPMRLEAKLIRNIVSNLRYQSVTSVRERRRRFGGDSIRTGNSDSKQPKTKTLQCFSESVLLLLTFKLGGDL